MIAAQSFFWENFKMDKERLEQFKEDVELKLEAFNQRNHNSGGVPRPQLYSDYDMFYLGVRDLGDDAAKWLYRTFLRELSPVNGANSKSLLKKLKSNLETEAKRREEIEEQATDERRDVLQSSKAYREFLEVLDTISTNGHDSEDIFYLKSRMDFDLTHGFSKDTIYLGEKRK